MNTVKAKRKARIPRFYHDEELQADSHLELSKKASHHLITVLKTKINDRIDLFNGDGINYEAVVLDTGQNASGKRARLQINNANIASTLSPVAITLIQAISRGDRMDSSIRQAVELGVNAIQPVYSRHSAKVLDDKRTLKKWEHWQNIIISACEQSGRAVVPLLSHPVNLFDWAKKQSSQEKSKGIKEKHSSVNFVLAPTATRTLSQYLTLESNPITSCGLIIGPESGFDDDEIVTTTDYGAVAVQFGARILRTETAGPASIAVIQSQLGDLK